MAPMTPLQVWDAIMEQFQHNARSVLKFTKKVPGMLVFQLYFVGLASDNRWFMIGVVFLIQTS